MLGESTFILMGMKNGFERGGGAECEVAVKNGVGKRWCGKGKGVRGCRPSRVP